MKGSASAPASSGNLGPGFDTLALALELRCSVVAEHADAWRITEKGETYEPESDDFVRSAISSMIAGSFAVEISNPIPRSRGLGSSSAVAVASGAAALRSVGEEPTSRFLFEAVSELEGHPDNAAAAAYGGLVAAGGGVVRNLDIHPDLHIVVGVPDEPLATATARAVLSSDIDRSAAARNLARVVFLVEGLRTGDPASLIGAGGDELHEEPRRDLSPITGRLMDTARRAGALHSAWSGAGPSAIAFAPVAVYEAVQNAMAEVLEGLGEVRSLDVATDGWR